MLTAFIEAAMRNAEYKKYDNGSWFGSIAAPGFDGVWANEATPEETRRELRSALEDWLQLGLQLHHRLPVIEGIDLNAAAVAA